METIQSKRFCDILSGGLQIGLETVIRKDVFARSLGFPQFTESIKLPEGFMMRVPKSKDATTVGLIHAATTDAIDLLDELYAKKTLTVSFVPLPEGLEKLFQQLNLQQIPDQRVKGLLCQRFTLLPEHPEHGPFKIKNKNEDPESPIGHINLDCFSKTKVWNPLYIKYRMTVAPSERRQEFGYIKIDAQINQGCVTVVVNRADESNVPEELKTSETFPR